MYNRCLATELGIFDSEKSRSFLCSAEKVKVQGDRMGLVLGGEGGVEMSACYLQECASNKTAMRN